MVTDHRGLVVWQKAHELTLKIYKVTQDFPGEEKYDLLPSFDAQPWP